MDVLLTGLVKSSHSKEVKRATLQALLKQATVLKAQHASLSTTAIKFLQSGEEIEEEFGLVLLSALSEHAKEETVGFLQPILPVLFLAHASALDGDLRQTIGNYSPRGFAEAGFGLVGFQLNIDVDTNTMKEALNLTFKKQHSLPRPVLSAMLRLIVAIPKTMPANDIFFRCAVEWTASVSLDVERPTFIEDSQMVDKLCSMVRRASSKTAAHALMLLKPIVATIDSEASPSPVMALLLPEVTADTPQTLRYLTLPETGLLKVVIALASWPQSKQVSNWLSLLLEQLKQLFGRGANTQGYYTLWLRIVEAAIPILARQLFIPALRLGALESLERFLLGGHQRSPKPFHGVLQVLLEVFKQLKDRSQHFQEMPEPLQYGEPARVNLQAVCEFELLVNNFEKSQKLMSAEPVNSSSLEDIDESLRKLSELLHIQMYQHQGYPELYTPVLHALSGYLRPADVLMKSRVASCAMITIDASEVASLEYDASSDTLVSAGRPSTLQAEGLCGLVNLGNTCFMNSFLQPLYLTDSLAAKMLHSPPAPGAETLRSLQVLFSCMKFTNRQYVAPQAFRQSLPDWLRGGQQQDASEFGRYLMDELDTQAKKLGEGSIVADEFGGTTATIIRCCTCGRQSIREEDFVDLVLSFPYQKDEGPVLELENMLEHFSSPEKLIGDNQYRCDSCGDLREAERRTAITKPPKHLILSLNRFSFDYTSQRRNKILQEVSYKERTSIVVEDVSSEATNRVSYILYAVIMHSGRSAEYGHYYSYARHTSGLFGSDKMDVDGPSEAQKGPSSQWFRFNDENVDASAFSSFSQITKHFPSDLAYMLFYVREDLDVPNSVSELHPELRSLVEADNSKFITELNAQRSRARSTRVSPGLSSLNASGSARRFDDDFGGGPPGFGGGFNNGIF